MHHRTVEMALTNQGIFPYYAFRNVYNKDDFLQEIYKFIQRSTEKTMKFQRDVLGYYSRIENNEEFDYLLNRRWTQVLIQDNPRNISFIDFFEISRSQVLAMNNYKISELKFGIPEVDFIEKNFLQRVTKGTKDLLAANLRMKARLREDFNGVKSKLLMIMLIRSIVAFVVIIFLHGKIIKKKENILKFYTSFQDSYVIQMDKKCENLMKKIEMEDNFENAIFEDLGAISSDEEEEKNFNLIKEKPT